MKLLYAITCHNRFDELNINRKLIRKYLPEADIVVLCNCSPEHQHEFMDARDKGFFWIENTGHIRGALEHVNMLAEHLEGYDWVIAQAAKSIWTDYTIIPRIITEM